MKVPALGRGLSSLIPPKQNGFTVQAEVAASAPELQRATNTEIIHIPLDRIDPNPLQPRQHFDDRTLQELADSIQLHGLLEPIVVTKNGDRWQIIAGERRFRAFQQLDETTIPAIVRSTSELERLELALIENIHREDLNPMEKAHAMAQLVNDFGLTQELAAKKLGVARSTLANTIRLLDLSTEIQQGIATGKISEGHAKIVLGLRTDEERLMVYKQMTQGKAMSVRDLSDMVEQRKGGFKRRSIHDYELQQTEQRLQGVLGTKVSIKRKANGGKQIIIDTYSDEEFQRVLDVIE